MAADTTTSVIELKAKDSTKGVFAKMDRNVKKVDRSTEGLNKSMKKTGVSIKAMVVGIVALGAAALTLNHALKSAKNFEKQMAEIGTLLNKSGTALTSYNNAIDDVMKKFGGEYVTSTKALYDTISAGFTTAAESTVLLNKASVLAIAGVTDVGTSVDLLTTVLNAYGEGAGSATKMSDVMFQTVKLGKTTIGDMAPVMGQVASTAAAMGVSFEEVGAAIATATSKGVFTSQAITGLKAALANVSKPTADALEMADQLKIAFSSKTLEDKGFSGLLNEIVDKSVAIGIKPKVAMEKLFGSIEALNTMFAISAGRGETFNKNLAEMANAAGSTAAAYDIMVKTFDFQSSALGGKISVVFKNMGNVLLNALIGPLTAINDNWDTWSHDIQRTWARVIDMSRYLGSSVVEAFQPWKSAFIWIKDLVLDFLIAPFKMAYDRIVGNSYVPDLVREVNAWFGKWRGSWDWIVDYTEVISEGFKNLYKNSIAGLGDLKQGIVDALADPNTMINAFFSKFSRVAILGIILLVQRKIKSLTANWVANNTAANQSAQRTNELLKQQAKFIEDSTKLSGAYGKKLKQLSDKGGSRSLLGRIIFGSGGWELAKAQLKDAQGVTRKFMKGLTATLAADGKVASYKQSFMHKVLFGKQSPEQLKKVADQLQKNVTASAAAMAASTNKRGLLSYLMFGASATGSAISAGIGSVFTKLGVSYKAQFAKMQISLLNRVIFGAGNGEGVKARFLTSLASIAFKASKIHVPGLSLLHKVAMGTAGGVFRTAKIFNSGLAFIGRGARKVATKLTGGLAGGMMAAMMLGDSFKSGMDNVVVKEGESIFENFSAKAKSFIDGVPTYGLLMLAMFGPLGTAAAAIGLIIKNWDVIKVKFNELMAWFGTPEAAETLGTGFASLGKAIVDAPWGEWFKGALIVIGGLMVGIWDYIIKPLGAALFDAIWGAFKSIGRSIRKGIFGAEEHAAIDYEAIRLTLQPQILKAQGRATGGMISGPGGPKADLIPAMLSNGEFVMNAQATKTFAPLLKAMNDNHYAKGGAVGDVENQLRSGVTVRTLLSNNESAANIKEALLALYKEFDATSIKNYTESLGGFKKVTDEALATLDSIDKVAAERALVLFQNDLKELVSSINAGGIDSEAVAELLLKNSELVSESQIKLNKHLVDLADVSTSAGKAIVNTVASIDTALTFADGWSKTIVDWQTDISDMSNFGTRSAKGLTNALDNMAGSFAQGEHHFKTLMKNLFRDFAENELKESMRLLMSTIVDSLNISNAPGAGASFISRLFGGAGGGSGGLADVNTAAGASAALSGLEFERFASGGRPPIGVPSIIGEKGPELFIPNIAGTIIPNDRMMSGAPVTINQSVNISEANDPAEFQRQLVKNNAVVVGMVQKAYQKQGSRRGPNG